MPFDPGLIAEQAAQNALLGPDGRPLAVADGIAIDGAMPAEANPDYRLDRRLARNQTVVPDFREHACPPAAQMLWLLERHAGVTPPWWLRISDRYQAVYGREVIARALWPQARVLWSLRPLDASKGIEFNWTDQDPNVRPTT